MANPTAPTDGGGAKLHFLLGDDGAGSEEAHLFKSLADRAAVVEGSDDKGAPLVVQNEEESGELLALVARTTDAQSADQTNHGWKGVMVFIECTAITASPVLTIIIEAKDPVSGVYFPIATFTNTIVAISSRAFILYPGALEDIVEADIEKQGLPLPSVWRLNVSADDADSCTYSAGYSYLA